MSSSTHDVDRGLVVTDHTTAARILADNIIAGVRQLTLTAGTHLQHLAAISAAVDAATTGRLPHTVAAHGLYYVTRDGSTCVDLEDAAIERALCALADVAYQPLPDTELDVCTTLLTLASKSLT